MYDCIFFKYVLRFSYQQLLTFLSVNHIVNGNCDYSSFTWCHPASHHTNTHHTTLTLTTHTTLTHNTHNTHRSQKDQLKKMKDMEVQRKRLEADLLNRSLKVRTLSQPVRTQHSLLDEYISLNYQDNIYLSATSSIPHLNALQNNAWNWSFVQTSCRSMHIV